MDKRQFELTVSNRTVIRVLLILLGTVLAWHFLSNITHILQLLFASAFLALAFNPAVSLLSRHLGIKRRFTATTLAYLIVLSVFVFFMMVVIAPLIKQTIIFVRDAPRTVENLSLIHI